MQDLRYFYDPVGNVVELQDDAQQTIMPHLAAIDRHHADRMQHADLGAGGGVYFQHDATRNRVRKVRVSSSGPAANERVYLGPLELYRERAVDSPDQLGPPKPPSLVPRMMARALHVRQSA